MTNSDERFTRCLHHATASTEVGGAFSPPIVNTSVYRLAGDPSGPYQYARWGNPTWSALEDALSILEEAETITFPSGMAAIASVLYSHLKSGDRLLLPSDGYYTVRLFAEKYLAPMGVVVDSCPTAEVAGRPFDGYKLVWVETPSNPGLDMADIAAVARNAKAAGAVVVVDNTTMTPLGQRPLDLGADVVVSVEQIVLGTTIPQQGAFYAAPWIAARLGMEGIGGPHIAQACATSVACIVAAATAVEVDRRRCSLVVTADRTSNGPLLVYPRSRAPGGSAAAENWVLDNFAADPRTGQAMVATAEAVAREGGFSRQAVDELTLLRYRQYAHALEDDRAFQRRTLAADRDRRRPAPDRRRRRRGRARHLRRSAARARALGRRRCRHLRQPDPSGRRQRRLRRPRRRGRELAGDKGVVRLLAAGFARAEKARMPKAATIAAVNALSDAGLAWRDVAIVNSHNPFAVDDLWFAQQTGFALEKMNPYGCSLVYGHPQAPTGLRGIVELVEALRMLGGGVGVFTGCAAGDTGAALVLRVD